MEVVTKTIQNEEYMALYDVVETVQELVLQGYRLPSRDHSETFPRKYGMGYYVISMVLPEPNRLNIGLDGSVESTALANSGIKEKQEAENHLQQFVSTLDKLTLKADLLDFAAKHGVNVPSDVKYPLEIKKYIKEAYVNGTFTEGEGA